VLYWAKLGPTVYDRAFLAGRPFAGVDREQMQPKKTPNLGYQSIDLSPIHASLKEIHAKYRDDFSGKVATYIPELAKADPRLFGVALVTADGQV